MERAVYMASGKARSLLKSLATTPRKKAKTMGERRVLPEEFQGVHSFPLLPEGPPLYNPVRCGLW
jgi:hypothetical protein